MENKKIVINVTGKAGIGKDTFIEHVRTLFPAKSTSSVYPIKRFLEDEFGISALDEDKTPEYRRLLATIYKEINSFAGENYLIKAYAEDIINTFLSDFSDEEEPKIIFVQIRTLEDYLEFKKNLTKDIQCYNLYAYSDLGNKNDYTGYPDVDNNTGLLSGFDFSVKVDDPNEVRNFVLKVGTL